MSWIEGVFSGPGAQLGQMSHTRHATHSAQYFFSHVTSFEKFRSFLSILTTKNNDQCPSLPGKNIRKNPMIPRSPTPFVLSYGFNLTEPLTLLQLYVAQFFHHNFPPEQTEFIICCTVFLTTIFHQSRRIDWFESWLVWVAIDWFESCLEENICKYEKDRKMIEP